MIFADPLQNDFWATSGRYRGAKSDRIIFLEPFLDFVSQKRSKSGVGFPTVDCFFADLVFRFSAEAPPEQI